MSNPVVACRDAGFPKRYQRGSLVLVWVLISLPTKTAWHFKLPSRSKAFGSHHFDSSFHRFPGAQIFIYKRLLISISRKALRWRDSRNSQRGLCTSDTQLDSLKARCPRRWTKPNMRCESRSCANTVERAHTNSLDADDKLIQTRPHVRNTIASKKRQVVMRKGKSTILGPTVGRLALFVGPSNTFCYGARGM